MQAEAGESRQLGVRENACVNIGLALEGEVPVATLRSHSPEGQTTSVQQDPERDRQQRTPEHPEISFC